MKKIMLFFSALCIVLSVMGQTLSTEWIKGAATSGVPGYMSSTGNNCRGMALGTLDFNSTPEKVLVIATREGGNKLVIVDPDTGEERTDLGSPIVLPADPVAGGTLPINDVAITADGKILVCNLAAPSPAAPTTFKVYCLDSPTDVPYLAVSYPIYDSGYPITQTTTRLGDFITVTGSISNNTAKIYAVDNNAASRRILCWSMSAGTFIITPDIFFSSGSLATGNFAYFDFLPGANNFLYSTSSDSQSANLVVGGEVRSIPTGAVAPTPGKVYLKYLSTASGYGNYGITYLAYLTASPGGGGTHTVKIARLPSGWNDVGELVNITNPATSESIGGNANTNIAGKIVSEIVGTEVYIYALATNNGIGKFRLYNVGTPVSLPPSDTPTGVEAQANSTSGITVANGILSVTGVDSPSITLYNTTGQKVKSALNANQLPVEGLQGVYIVRVAQDDAVVKRAKVFIK